MQQQQTSKLLWITAKNEFTDIKGRYYSYLKILQISVSIFLLDKKINASFLWKLFSPEIDKIWRSAKNKLVLTLWSSSKLITNDL